MASDELCMIQVRKVAQDVLISFWFSQGLISAEQMQRPESSFVLDITDEFVNNLCVVVKFKTHCNEFIWKGFLSNHLIRMIKTPYLFANYFAYASYILSERIKNAFTCFIEILSLVTHFAHFCWQQTDDDKFVKSCVDLFCAFFDKELCKEFKDRGLLKKFNEYLKGEYHEAILKKYDEVLRKEKSLTDALLEYQSTYNESETPHITNEVLKNITTLQVEEDKKAISFADFVGDKMKEVCGKPFGEVLDDFQKTEKRMEELSRETTDVESGENTSAEDQSSSQEIPEFENIRSMAKLTKNKDRSKEMEAHKALEKVIQDFRKSDNPTETTIQESVGDDSGDLENQSSSHKTKKTFGNIPSKKEVNKTCALIKENKASDPLETRDSSPAPKESVQIPDLTEKDINETKILLQEMLSDIQKISELFRFLCENKAF